jgi:cytochrome b
MSLGDAPASAARRVRIWDLPTRTFHWLLAGLGVAAIARLGS